MEHSYASFDPCNFDQAAILKSKDFCLVGDKFGVGIRVQISAETKRGKKTRQVLPIHLSLGRPSYSVPMLVGERQQLSSVPPLLKKKFSLGIVLADVQNFDDELGGGFFLSDVQNLNMSRQDLIIFLNYYGCVWMLIEVHLAMF